MLIEYQWFDLMETGGRVWTLTLFLYVIAKRQDQCTVLFIWIIYLGMFREAFFSMCRRKGSLRTVSLFVYNTIMWCAWGHTFLCLPCATWRELKMWVGRFFYCFVFFYHKAGWMLIKDAFPAGTDYWRCSDADVCLSLCLGTLGQLINSLLVCL